ncbi:MAG: WbqC family protein [Saprospiraceae bacterium]
MNTILHESHILGPIPLYSMYLCTDVILIEAQENYHKRSMRNRFDLLTANGVQTLTIPLVKGKNNQQKIKDVLISYDEQWMDKHLHSIRSAYGKSPYFEYYFDQLSDLFTQRFEYLFDFNLSVLHFTLLSLKIHKDIQFTKTYEHSYHQVIDVRNTDWQNPESVGRIYPQVWNQKFDFIPNLSILDLLFCTGPEAIFYLQSLDQNRTNQTF